MDALINTVSAIILILVGFALALLKSFVQEKGKNYAIKDDLKEITRIAEGVKSTFAEQTEKLKSSLTLVSNVFVGLVVEERNAIVDFNEKYFLWFNTLTDIRLGGASIKSVVELIEHKKQVEACRINYMNSKARFELFVEDLEFNLFINQMEGKTMELFDVLKLNHIHNLESIHREMGVINIGFLDNPIESQIKIDKLFEEISESVEKFNNGIVEGVPVIRKVHSDFHQKCRSRLYQLIDHEN